MAFASGPVPLLALQVLNAWFFAAVAGVGLTLFQELIPRPGLASGLYANTRRLGAVASGPLIGAGSTTALGYGGVFLASAVITAVALAGLRMVPAEHGESVPGLTTRRRQTWRRVRATRRSGRGRRDGRRRPVA
ncbi:hypothetical protein [Paractinoplanes maris]|uniref:hypothetical protein n=1 Tax=Paractinoplanes maris TaxID=1734446 RepID=UPI0034DAC039